LRVTLQSDTNSLQLAVSHHRAGELAKAEQLYNSILEDEPGNVDALHLLGVLYSETERHNIGIRYIRHAIELFPEMVEAHYNLGNVLTNINQQVEAIASYEEATRLNPSHSNAWLNKGDAYRRLRKMKDAEDCYLRALEVDSSNRHLYVRLGAVLRAQGRPREAAVAYQRALAIDPTAADANNNLGNILYDANQFEQALKYYAMSRSASRPHPLAAGMMLSCITRTCCWDDGMMEQGGLSELQDEILHPFTVLTLSVSGQEQQKFARRYANYLGHGIRDTTAAQRKERAGKIRIGYLSADFQQHATAYLIAELFEVHDRSVFEIIGVSYGRDDGSLVRRRLLNGFDEFIDIADVDDDAAAQRIALAGIDILVDLKGYTRDAREGIVARRPAPVIVSYLGYPGTLGTPAIDYILGDRIALPFADQQFYDEKIVHLPHCYQVNDSTLEIDDNPSTRIQHGLPEGAFVFCCLNGSQKITPDVFATWLRILAAVPNSVLWLYSDNETAKQNLLRIAIAQDLDSKRVIFAPPLPHREHLARYQHADLFLDTTPYNAHTTASDALRAHLPILTVYGATFASRVAASLLHAVGVPELVVGDLTAYEAQAIALANDARRLARIRERIANGVATGPLFNTRQFASGIEAAFRYMISRANLGLQPRPFAVCSDGVIQEVPE